MDAPVNQFDGELAALQHRRQMEDLAASSASAALGELAEIADQLGIPRAGLFRSALRSGQTPVELVVEQLESGAQAEIARIWKHLDGQDDRLKEFAARLQSHEAQGAYLSAMLHGLRTSDPKKQFRLGAITVSSIYTNDAQPEILDGMMRATIELQDKDIALLGEIYDMQSPFMRTQHWMDREIADKWNSLAGYWQEYWNKNKARYRGSSGINLMGSFARLESLGMIAPGPNRSSAESPVAQCYFLLPDGARFHELLRDRAEPQ